MLPAGSAHPRLGLGLRTSARLAVTPALRQAIHLLELPALELGQLLRTELEANPWLDLADDAAEPEPGPSDAGAGDDPDGHGEPWTGPGDPRADPPVPAPAPDLRDHVGLQLRLQPPDPARDAALALVDWLDDDGYLRHPEDARARLGVNGAAFAAAVERLQGCDPPGVGARTLAECIGLQLRVVAPGDRLAAAIAKDHLERAARNAVRRLASLLNASPAAVERALDAIRRCDPRPGLAFSGSGAATVFPDVVVERDGDQFAILVNDGILPRLRLSPTYRRLLRDREKCPPDARSFLEGRLAEATRLLRAVEVRRRTLHRVTEAIIGLQHGYFEEGVAGLRPLTLEEVARVAGVHPSTVSRATMHKFVQTPRGTVPFRFFFPSAPRASHARRAAGAAGAAGAPAVQARLRALVAAEDPGRPLSDGELARRLAGDGMPVARRTVAKYRDRLRIPPAAGRRR